MNVIDGLGLIAVLSGKVSLKELIKLKARYTTETGRAFVGYEDLKSSYE